MRHVRPIALTLAAALVVVPSLAEAQRVTVRRGTTTERQQVYRSRDHDAHRQMTLAVGVLRHDGVSDDNFAMAALRTDWRLAHWLRSELSVSYALAEVEAPAGSGEDDMDSHLLNATVGLNAELPVPVIRPYVGIAGGLFGRFDSEGGEDFVRPSVAVPVGVRIPLTSRLGLRGEVRWRFDQQEGGGDAAVNREQTIGVSFGF
jgi:hypothetical protein